MGYNARAVRLHALAQIVVREHGGIIPHDVTRLRSLPGVGPYTANAVRCFAFGQHVEVVDVNVSRVLSRVFRKSPSAIPQAELSLLAQRALPRDAYPWNQALMDIGSTICTARRPRCTECPLRAVCSSVSVKSVQVDSPAAAARRPEPHYAGMPRRIWRGKIVEALRRRPRTRPLTLLELGRIVKPDFAAGELAWLRTVADALARDGVVEYRRPHTVRLAS
jgi:A/G-specific adenine glycosylase